jgi:uncharacterized membrane protein
MPQVFGEYEGTYCWSLGKTYMTYSTSIALSVLTNYILTAVLGFSHEVAWVVTLLWTGVYNFFLLKASWAKKTKPGASTKHAEQTNAV